MTLWMLLAVGSSSPLRFNAVKGGFGIVVGASWSQPWPLAAEFVRRSDGVATWSAAPYVYVDAAAGNAYGTVVSPSGSRLAFNDTFSPTSDGFIMDRVVRVLAASHSDSAFSTRFSLQFASNVSRCSEWFIPSVAYGPLSAAYVEPTALAGDPAAAHVLIREDRLPLPLAMCRDTVSGASATLAHRVRRGEGATYAGENFRPRLTDARLQFGSVGFLQNGARGGARATFATAFQFPGSEGDRSYIGGAKAGWANRSHPLESAPPQPPLAHAYELRFSLRASSASYAAAVQAAWRGAFDDAAAVAAPPSVDNDALVYAASMDLLARYGVAYDGGTPSMPFRATLPEGVVDDSSSQMGFVGKALPAAALLLRSGVEGGNATRCAQAAAIVDFWVAHALELSSSGQPATWYNTVAGGGHAWRHETPESGNLRIASEGAMGALEAWRVAPDARPNWIAFAKTYGDFVVARQNADGSIFGEWRRNGSVWSPAGNFTNVGDVAIPLLVQLFNATGDAAYRDAALAAGEFSRAAMSASFAYAGGACDNPNVLDKEAGVLAMEAFLALHAMTSSSVSFPSAPSLRASNATRNKWLDAALQAAVYSATWVYSWDVPIPADDPDVVYPTSRTTLGASIIATGQSGADNFMAIAVYPYYRLYLLTRDAHWLDFSRFLARATKQIVDWDDTLSYAFRGLMNEAVSMAPPRGHGVRKWLPWLTVAVLDPMVKMREWCGGFALRARGEMSASEATRCATAGAQQQ